MNTLVTYTEPQLCSYSGNLTKKWFVYFDAVHPLTKERKRIQTRGSINNFATKEERIREAKAMIKAWKKAQEAGYNPFDEMPAVNLTRLRFNEALDFGLAKCDLSKKTISTYRTPIKYIKEAASKMLLAHFYVTDIKRQHIKLILEKTRELRTLSNKNYNKYSDTLRAIMGRLVQWEIIEHNPAEKIKPMRTVETQKYKPLTADEKKKISEHLYIHHYNYFVFLMLIYHAGIRPKEILALKISDIDLKEQEISIYPDLVEENSKTTKIRKVAINNELLPFLRELHLHEYPSNYYVFGSPYPSGQGNRGSAKGGLTGSMHPDYLKPSETPVKRDTVTRLWQTIVKDKLKIDKYQYALKHTGANEKIMAGISLEALQQMYGHSSKLMTMKYATIVKQVYANEIKAKSPAF